MHPTPLARWRHRPLRPSLVSHTETGQKTHRERGFVVGRCPEGLLPGLQLSVLDRMLLVGLEEVELEPLRLGGDAGEEVWEIARDKGCGRGLELAGLEIEAISDLKIPSGVAVGLGEEEHDGDVEQR